MLESLLQINKIPSALSHVESEIDEAKTVVGSKEITSPFDLFSLKPKQRIRSDWEPRKIRNKIISEE